MDKKENVVNSPRNKQGIWGFDKDSQTISVLPEKIINARNESMFMFKVFRYKDDVTHEENLKIVCHCKNEDGEQEEENGTVTTNLYSLDNDIKQFMRYGVAFTPIQFLDLKKIIESSYLDINSTKSSDISFDGDTRFNNLIEAIKEFANDSKDYIDNDFCYVPVKFFDDLANDCGYNNYELKSLRETLSKQYIHTAPGRYSRIKRIKDKPERVIAFFRKKIGVDIPKKKDNKRAVKGDGSEK